MDLESKRPSGPLFRVGRDDDAWAVPDWAYAKEDRTFGNRFDDPMGVYRVLYASSQRLGCFIETLVRFRVDVSFVADLALMENGEDDFTAFGTSAEDGSRDAALARHMSKGSMPTDCRAFMTGIFGKGISIFGRLERYVRFPIASPGARQHQQQSPASPSGARLHPRPVDRTDLAGLRFPTHESEDLPNSSHSCRILHAT